MTAHLPCHVTGLLSSSQSESFLLSGTLYLGRKLSSRGSLVGRRWQIRTPQLRFNTEQLSEHRGAEGQLQLLNCRAVCDRRTSFCLRRYQKNQKVGILRTNDGPKLKVRGPHKAAHERFYGVVSWSTTKNGTREPKDA